MKKIVLIIFLLTVSTNAKVTITKLKNGDTKTVVTDTMFDYTRIETPYITKISPKISIAISLGGITLGASEETLDSNFELQEDSIVGNSYTKNLTNDLYPFEKVIVFVTPISKQIYSIQLIMNDKIQNNTEECVVIKNQFLQAVFDKYGGKYYNNERISITERGDAEIRQNKESFGWVHVTDKIHFIFPCNDISIATAEYGWNFTLIDDSLIVVNDTEKSNEIQTQEIQQLEKQKEVINRLL